MYCIMIHIITCLADLETACRKYCTDSTAQEDNGSDEGTNHRKLVTLGLSESTDGKKSRACPNMSHIFVQIIDRLLFVTTCSVCNFDQRFMTLLARVTDTHPSLVISLSLSFGPCGTNVGHNQVIVSSDISFAYNSILSKRERQDFPHSFMS